MVVEEVTKRTESETRLLHRTHNTRWLGEAPTLSAVLIRNRYFLSEASLPLQGICEASRS